MNNIVIYNEKYIYDLCIVPVTKLLKPLEFPK